MLSLTFLLGLTSEDRSARQDPQPHPKLLLTAPGFTSCPMSCPPPSHALGVVPTGDCSTSETSCGHHTPSHSCPTTHTHATQTRFPALSLASSYAFPPLDTLPPQLLSIPSWPTEPILPSPLQPHPLPPTTHPPRNLRSLLLSTSLPPCPTFPCRFHLFNISV